MLNSVNTIQIQIIDNKTLLFPMNCNKIVLESNFIHYTDVHVYSQILCERISSSKITRLNFNTSKCLENLTEQ